MNAQEWQAVARPISWTDAGGTSAPRHPLTVTETDPTVLHD